jgi:hypothetical protein
MLECVLCLVLLTSSYSAHGQERKVNTDSGAFLYEACQLRTKVMNDATVKLEPRQAMRALMCDS